MAIGTRISELTQGSKEDLATALMRVSASVKRNKDVIKQKTEDTMGVFTSVAGGGLAGYLMGARSYRIETDASIVGAEAKNEAMKLGGYVDPDVALGAIFAFMGLSGLGGKKASGTLTNLGGGVLSFYAGSKAFDAAQTRAKDAAAAGV